MKWIVALLLVMLVWLQVRLWSGDGGIAEVWRLRQGIRAEEQSNAAQHERNQVLEAEVRNLKKGKDAIEERARSELGMIKKDETFYLMVEGE